MYNVLHYLILNSSMHKSHFSLYNEGLFIMIAACRFKVYLLWLHFGSKLESFAFLTLSFLMPILL